MKLVFTLFVLILSQVLLSQEKVKWDFTYNTNNKTIEMKATIDEGWHLYSQYINNKIGPVPTAFVFTPTEKVKLIGKTEEPTPIKEYDENFEATLDFYKGEVVFSQKVEFISPQTIDGYVTFMVCNETMCLPPSDIPFKIELK
jgi:thiol:disulfide interchange protein DsbD